jgi:hypothetical protein
MAPEREETSMERIRTHVRRYFQGWSMVDPAVALGLFGTGVGLAVPELPARAQTGPVARVA